MPWLGPKERRTIGTRELYRGLRMLLYDGVCSQVMGTLTGGAFLVAYVLALGGSNAAVGLIATVGALSQLLQLPAALLIERRRRRKALAVTSAVAGRLLWFAAAAIPWLAAPRTGAGLLLALLIPFFALGAVTTGAFNSWVRDLVPERTMGRYFARRLAVATAASAAIGLLASFLVQQGGAGPARAAAYSWLFAAGGAVGLLGATFLARVPEPQMPAAHARPLRDILREPLADRAYRNVIVFLGVWTFAVNLAAPFFVVYMLRRLGLAVPVIVALSVLSQAVNALFLRLWGRLADQFSNVSVLQVSCGLFLVSIALWPVTTLGSLYTVALPTVILIHLLSGIASAGVNLCTGTLALKAAPRGEATAYLATNALTSGLAATLAPGLAGLAADLLVGNRLTLELHWFSTTGAGARGAVPALDLRGLDFLFVAAFLVGLYALHRLSAVHEEGTVKEEVLVTAAYQQVRQSVRDVSSVPGLRQLADFPFAVLGRVFPERRRGGRPRRPPTADELARRGSSRAPAPG